jgi:hypothetical protein
MRLISMHRDMPKGYLIFARDIFRVAAIPQIWREFLETRVAEILKTQGEFFKSIWIRCLESGDQ